MFAHELIECLMENPEMEVMVMNSSSLGEDGMCDVFDVEMVRITTKGNGQEIYALEIYDSKDIDPSIIHPN